MKKKLLILVSALAAVVLAFVGLVVVTGYQCCNSAADVTALAAADRRPSGNEAARAAAPERISLFSVELQCPLVTRLGCGTESKPIMAKLDSHQAVVGTWLNHAGNMLAVLWNQEDATERSEALGVAFQNQTGPTELQGSSRDAALSDFLSGIAWYRTSALDELSGQEADAVATRWVSKISAVVPMPHKVREAVRRKLSDEMRCRFVGH